MKKTIPVAVLTALVVFTGFYVFQKPQNEEFDAAILPYVIDPKAQTIAFFWKDSTQKRYENFENLRTALNAEIQELVFAVNGGMFDTEKSPVGLYIENGKMLTPLDTARQGYGNFYLQPNGVFYLTNDNQAVICTTADFKMDENIKYATQSGPILVIGEQLHPVFQEGSANLNIRNGVGILPDGKLLFAMSKNKINFYDFAVFFQKMGCRNALYLDGFVSRTYLPAQGWEQTDGDFGVIIAEIKKI